MTNRPKAIVFDIDGTLVDVSAVRHHVKGGPENGYRKDFDKFHSEAVTCPAIEWVLKAAQDAAAEYRVIQVTARSERYRPSTSWWLAEHYVPSDGLYMRPDRDHRPDYEVKREIVDRLLLRYDIVQAYDDNPNVIRLWGEYGIPCIEIPGWEDFG